MKFEKSYKFASLNFEKFEVRIGSKFASLRACKFESAVAHRVYRFWVWGLGFGASGEWFRVSVLWFIYMLCVIGFWV